MKRLAPVLLGLLPVAALAYTISLSWTNPTERVDGTPLAASEIKETVISCGTPNGPYDQFTWVSPGAATSASPPTQFNGKTCCVAQTKDQFDQLSDYSNEACKTPGRPKPPADFTVQ